MGQVSSQVLIGRFMWWAPWSVTRPWLPRGWLGTDEWCTRAVSVVVPLLGAFHWFYGERRTMPCGECWSCMGTEQRADYLPGGYLEGGRVHPERAEFA